MSCDGNRATYFAAVSGANSAVTQAFGGEVAARQALDDLFDLGRSGPKPLADAKLVEAQTRLLFTSMTRLKIKPPTHSANGLPKTDAQHGYALIQRTLAALDKGEPLPHQARDLFLTRERERQITNLRADASGRVRCGGCGQFASPIRGHVCSRTSNTAALRRSLVRRLGVPSSAYPDDKLAELLDAARVEDVLMRHPATGETVRVSLDGLPLAMGNGFVPELWADEGRRAATPSGTVITVLDSTGLSPLITTTTLHPQLVAKCEDVRVRMRMATDPDERGRLHTYLHDLEDAVRDTVATAMVAADFGLQITPTMPVVGLPTALQPAPLTGAEAAWLNRAAGSRTWKAGDTPHGAAVALLGDRAAAVRTPASRPSPESFAYGSDPTRAYKVRYRVVDLDDLVPSNLDSGAINPAYDATLQPRQRDRVASQAQIAKVAQTLTPDALLTDFKQLDKGTPIIGSEDTCVESGNGRVLALRKAREVFPAQWDAYQNRLRDVVDSFGIDAATLSGMRSPVLVRERLDQVDRTAFAREANSPPVLQMSTLENARVDAKRLTDDTMLRLQVREDQSIDLALRANSNRPFVRDFMQTLPDNERATLMRADGTLNQQGIWRIKAALFTRVFPGEAGGRLAETFTEALDSTTRNFESAVAGTLPALVRAQGRISSGQRSPNLDLSADMAMSLDMLSRLREQDMPVTVYLEQSSLFERELTPIQETMLRHFDKIGRTPKAIRGFLNTYAQAIEDAPDPNQVDMFGGGGLSKEQIFNRIAGQPVDAAPAVVTT